MRKTWADDGTGRAMAYIALDKGIAERIDRILYCFAGLLDPWKVKLPCLLMVLAVLGILLCRYGFRPAKGTLRLLWIALYPVGWIFVVTRHSQHYWVANILSIFVYAVLSAVCLSVGEIPKKNKENAGFSESE